MRKNEDVRVVKSDGTIEPFQFVKLRRSLACAMRGCDYDERYAEALARAVAVHLQAWHEPQPPSTDYVFRCARTVLEETGLGEVARELVRHRLARAARRRRVSITAKGGTPSGDRAWEKGQVAQTLIHTYRIKPDVARILASEVESRVLALNYSVVSTALIRELIRNELMAWGLSEPTRRDEAVAIDASLAARAEGESKT